MQEIFNSLCVLDFQATCSLNVQTVESDGLLFKGKRWDRVVTVVRQCPGAFANSKLLECDLIFIEAGLKVFYSSKFLNQVNDVN